MAGEPQGAQPGALRDEGSPQNGGGAMHKPGNDAPVAPVASPPYPALGVAAKAIVVNQAGEVLIIRRSPGSATDPGLWDLPGGKMDDRERLVDALVREVKEETSLVVRGDDTRPIYVTHFVKEPFWVTCVTFLCTAFEGEVRLGTEHTGFRWVTPGEDAGRRYARGIGEQLRAYASRP